MKKNDKILAVIEKDRLSLSKSASSMIEKDLYYLLCQYFDLASLPTLTITEGKRGYKISVTAECDSLKSFTIAK